jgi:putative inorganic carbon (hco3(-)) transporter
MGMPDHSVEPSAPGVIASGPARSRSATPASLLFVLSTAFLVALPLAFTAGDSGLLPLAALAGLSGTVALVVLAAFAGTHALPRLLFIAVVGLAFVPYDKYLLYVEHVGGWPGIRVGAADITLAPLLLLVGLGCWLRRIRNAIPAALLGVYALLLVHYLISSLGAPRQDLAFFELLAAGHAMLLAWVVAALYRREMLVPVLLILAAAVLAHAAAGVAEFVLRRPVGPDSAERTVLEEILRSGATMLRPSGLFVHPIALADFFMMTLPALAGAVIAIHRRWQRVALAAVGGLGAVVLGLTLSRGAWLSTAFAGGVMLILASREGLLTAAVRRRLHSIAVAAAIVGIAFIPIAWERLTQSDPGNVQVRFDLNRIALSMTSAHPFAGVGLNNFVPVMPRYDPKNVASYFPAPAHNLYLLEAAEAGVPGLVLFMLFVGALLASANRKLRAARLSHDLLTRWIALGLLSSLWGLVLSQLADFSWRLEPLRTIIWLEIGLLFGMLAPTAPSPAANQP